MRQLIEFTKPDSVGANRTTCPFSRRELQFCREVASMGFLVRIAFWLGLIIALLPIAPLRQETSASKVGAVDSLAATSAAVSPPWHADPTAEVFVLTIPVVRFYWRVDAVGSNWSPLAEQLQLGSFAGCDATEAPCE
jgi:hypothetical protein